MYQSDLHDLIDFEATDIEFEATDLYDLLFFGSVTAAAAGMGGMAGADGVEDWGGGGAALAVVRGGTYTPAAGGVALLFCTCCICGVSCILLNAPPSPCFCTILLLANSARRTIAAMPRRPTAIPIPAAAALLTLPPPTASSFASIEFEFEAATVGLAAAECDVEADAETDAEAEAEVVETAADVLVAVLDLVALFDTVAVLVEGDWGSPEVADEAAELSLLPPRATASNMSSSASTDSPLWISGCVSQPTSPT